MSLNEFFPLLTNSVHGLFYLHRNLMVHRDIKPENLMLSKSSGWQYADYGVGINIQIYDNFDVLSEEEPEMFHIGHYGVAGTPDYLDPLLRN